MQPITSYAVDTLKFTTTTENYQVLLMFNDTINIWGNTTDNKHQHNGVNLAPNPAKEFTQIQINTEETGFAELTVYNSSAQCCIYKKLNLISPESKSVLLDTHMLKPGIYTVKIRIAEKLFTKRLVIQ